jgi:hypothetical protein
MGENYNFLSFNKCSIFLKTPLNHQCYIKLCLAEGLDLEAKTFSQKSVNWHCVISIASGLHYIQHRLTNFPPRFCVHFSYFSTQATGNSYREWGKSRKSQTFS